MRLRLDLCFQLVQPLGYNLQAYQGRNLAHDLSLIFFHGFCEHFDTHIKRVEPRIHIFLKVIDSCIKALFDPSDPLIEVLLDPVDPCIEVFFYTCDPLIKALLDPVNPLLDPAKTLVDPFLQNIKPDSQRTEIWSHQIFKNFANILYCSHMYLPALLPCFPSLQNRTSYR